MVRTRLPLMWPGFKYRCRQNYVHEWVEVAVGSLPCSERILSGYSRFPHSSKTNICKFQYDQEWQTKPNHYVDALPWRNLHVPTPLRFHRQYAGASDAWLWILKTDTALLPGLVGYRYHWRRNCIFYLHKCLPPSPFLSYSDSGRIFGGCQYPPYCPPG